MNPKRIFRRPAGANPTPGAIDTSGTDTTAPKEATDSIGTLDPTKLVRLGIPPATPSTAIVQTTPAPSPTVAGTWAALSSTEKWMIGGAGLLVLIGLGYVLSKSKAA